VSGRIEQVESGAPSPAMEPDMESVFPTATTFELHWPNYNAAEPAGAANYSYKVVLTCENPIQFLACDDRTFTFMFVRDESNPTPPPPSKTPGGSPQKSPEKREESPVSLITPVAADGCVPMAYCDFHVCFPHNDAVAVYNVCDGLLAFGEAPHCVQFVSRMYKEGDTKTYHGMPVRMGPGWWIIQYKRSQPSDAPIGNVTMVVEDTKCTDSSKKRRWIKFCILDAGCEPGHLMPGKKMLRFRR
jgi:hypothetical protein